MTAQTPPITPPLRIRVFLASPGDVSDERAPALKMLERLPYDAFQALQQQGCPKVLVYRRMEEPQFGAEDPYIPGKLEQWQSRRGHRLLSHSSGNPPGLVAGLLRSPYPAKIDSFPLVPFCERISYIDPRPLPGLAFSGGVSELCNNAIAKDNLVKSEVVRNALDAYLASEAPPLSGSALDLAGDLVGALEGPVDLYHHQG